MMMASSYFALYRRDSHAADGKPRPTRSSGLFLLDRLHVVAVDGDAAWLHRSGTSRTRAIFRSPSWKDAPLTCT